MISRHDKGFSLLLEISEFVSNNEMFQLERDYDSEGFAFYSNLHSWLIMVGNAIVYIKRDVYQCMGERQMHTVFWLKNLKRRHYSRKVDVDGRILLNGY